MGVCDLLSLQGKVKRDAEGYRDEFLAQYRHYQACLRIFSLKPSAEAEDFGDLVTFIAHVAPYFRKETIAFPQEIADLLRTHSNILNPSLRKTLAQALILLRNRQIITSSTLLPLFFHLFRCPDKSLRHLVYSHIVNDIRRGNKKHNNVQFNRPLQNFLYDMVLDESEVAAKKSLAVLIELHRRNVWRDSRTVNVIAAACFHKQGRILAAALKFFLVNDEEADDDEGDDDEDDDEGGEENGDGGGGGEATIGVNREDIYKAYHKGAARSKKKKQAKLKRVMRSLKRSQKCKSGDGGASFTAIQLLNDPQGFAEKLFARLKSSNERFEVKLMMMNVISRVVGTHKLALLNFYPFLQRYVQPHQRDVTRLLAAAIQACHDQVPPDAVEPLLKQVVNQFVHDRARPEVIAVGLNTVRDMCLRMPLIMTEDLLQDLALYKKERQKAVSSAARGIIALFRELKPSLLEKKDRGRGADLTAKPLEFGETVVAEGVPGLDLLLRHRDDSDHEDDDNDGDEEEEEEDEEEEEEDDDDDDVELVGDDMRDGCAEQRSDGGDDEDEDDEDEDGDDNGSERVDSSDGEEKEEEQDEEEEEEEEEGEGMKSGGRKEEGKVGDEMEEIGNEDRCERSDGEENTPETSGKEDEKGEEEKKKKVGKKEKKVEVVSANMSLRTLKRLAVERKEREEEARRKLKVEELLSTVNDGFLSNEDFKQIRNLQSKQALEAAMVKHGIKKQNGVGAERRKSFELPLMTKYNRETISERRVNPADLEAKIKRRREREERVASVMAGREGRDDFGASAARKKQKTGGTSNREKQRKKALPLAAQWSKAKARSSSKQRRAGIAAKQFKGKKAWK